MSTLYEYNVTITVPVKSIVPPAASRAKLADDVIGVFWNLTVAQLYDYIDTVSLVGNPRLREIFAAELPHQERG